jgi:hypothetical protein
MIEKLRSPMFQSRILVWILIILTISGYLHPLGLPITIGKNTISFANAMKNVPSGGTVVLSIGFGVNALVNFGGQCLVATKYFADRGDVKIIIWGSSTDTMAVYEQLLRPALVKKQYGVDYVVLGYFSGGETGVAKLSDDIAGVFKTDTFGTPIEKLPIMTGIQDASDIALLMTFDNSYERNWYVGQWYQRYQSKIVVTVVAIDLIDVERMMAAGQLVGGSSDVRGAAELEIYFGYPGRSVIGTDVSSLGHAYMILLLIFGNIQEIMKMRRKKINGV